MPLGLTLEQVLLLATGGLVEVCALLLLALLVARRRARGAVVRRRELQDQRPHVVVGVVVEHLAPSAPAITRGGAG